MSGDTHTLHCSALMFAVNLAHSASAPPALARRQPGVFGDVEEDLVDQFGALVDRPLPQRPRLRVVLAGMAEEYPRHGLIVPELIS